MGRTSPSGIPRDAPCGSIVLLPTLGIAALSQEWTLGSDQECRNKVVWLYVASDEHAGLMAAIRRDFAEAARQRCQVSSQRNALSLVTTPTRQQASQAGLRDAWAAPARPEAERRGEQLIPDLRPTLPAVATRIKETLGDTLAIHALQEAEARHRLRTTNALELEHEEVRHAPREGDLPHRPHGIAAIAASIRRAKAIGWISFPWNIHWFSTATVRVFGKTNRYWPP
jgi:hypothetical protein